MHRIAAHSALLLVAAFSLLFTAKSPSAEAESLNDALAQAYRTNEQLLAERAQLRAVDDNVPIALAGWRPTVSVTAQQGVVHNSNKLDCGKAPAGPFGSSPDCSYHALNTFENLWPQAYGLTISQPVYRGGRTVAESSEAYNFVQSERARLMDVEQTVFITVITDYINVLAEQAILDLSVNNEQVMRGLLQSALYRAGIGELTRTDSSQAGAFFSQALATMQQTETQLNIFRSAYQHDVGSAPERLKAPTTVPELPTSRDEATTVAAVTAPTVISAQFTKAAAEDNIDLVRGQALPQLSVVASIQRAKELQQSGLRTDTGQVVAQLSFPFYQGGSVAAQVEQAHDAVAIRQHQVDEARRLAVQNAGQAWDGLQGTRRVLDLLRTTMRENEKALEGVQHEALVGDRTVYDILNQEQLLFQSRVSFVQSQHDELIYEFTLAQALGRLTAKNLALPVEYYDPEKHFDAVH